MKKDLYYDKLGQCAWCGAKAALGRIDLDGTRYSACRRHRNLSFSVIPTKKHPPFTRKA